MILMFTRVFKRFSKKAGLPPGEVVFVGEKKVEKVGASFINYNESFYDEGVIEDIGDCLSVLSKGTVTWINVIGVHDIDVIKKIGEQFKIHSLVLEDIANTEQRPKYENYKDYIYIILKMINYNKETGEVITEHVSLILFSSLVISFQEMEGDVFNNIILRIKQGKGRIRKMGADYLVYALMDALVDGYYVCLEKIGEKIEDVENEIIENPSPELLQAIYKHRNSLVILRRSLWPLRETASNIYREESDLIKDETHIYLRDFYEHTTQAIETVEIYRDMVTGMQDIYMSSVSNKMNEVMKILTIIATIFIPLTFIAGIYGMNFQNMPELGWQWGYPVIILIMTITAGIMITYFIRKKWL